MATIVLGVQWGDEGKGKLCDILGSGADICARATGGRNCGHTVVANGVSYDFHMLPSGLLNSSARNLIGPGVVLHLPTFFEELKKLQGQDIPDIEQRIFVSKRCALNLDLHEIADCIYEDSLGSNSIGTTRRGIAERTNLIVADLFEDDILEHKMKTLAKQFGHSHGVNETNYDVEGEISKLKGLREKLRPFCIDDVEYLEAEQTQDKKIIIEGAQSAMLDLVYGTYPHVTSTPTTFGGVMAGLNINRRKIDAVIGVVKAYTTRVGEGPFPTDHEFGVSTGRARRCGCFAKYSHQVNHYDYLNLTKLDILDDFDTIQVAIGYKNPETGEILRTYPASAALLSRVEPVYLALKGWQRPTTHVKEFQRLPEEAQGYIRLIESFLGVPVRWIGTGPGREDIIVKND
ncbi:Adenylosuccinate synthetase [Rhypophila sp. PSN 637]